MTTENADNTQEASSVQRLVSGRTVWWTHQWEAGDESGTSLLPFLLQKAMGDKAKVINDVGFVSIVRTDDLTHGESANTH
jgi:succinate dehydrogenase/fumarate reductase flavoprotein subunit